ncbi:MAG TPA: prevent-host-death protein [Chloroflexia bacterium]|nr:prevent-host-death protein [Chloroflexia bacterium]
MHQLELDDAQKHLAELIEAALKGVEVIISKDNHQLVQLIAVKTAQPHLVFGSAKGLIEFSPDFDVLPDDFQEYTA